ncbi:hypothetical protein [Mucilaginibacter aquaedulcis]|uniref:hypothetical protein n=1 Tax=Mucilaginibacter aquaedulcis TaxID=1187081 RepID=UPI0025B2DEF0|nr:hypothetical protein [Mucilaginibacter aquaedulcis]MDN3549962.1 hypothetical protein [Mucilaginibacter aquaedulcis]
MKTLLFLPFFLTMYYTSGAQQTDNDISVHIESVGSGFPRNKSKIDVIKHNETIKITYSSLDSIGFKTLGKNPRYVRLINNFMPQLKQNTSQDSLKKTVRELDTLTGTQEYYSTNSISLNSTTDTAYTSLLYKLNATSTDSLENKAANHSRIIMDGVHIKFKIQNGDSTRIVNAHSPTSQSNPLLYAFMEETSRIYRQKKQPK